MRLGLSQVMKKDIREAMKNAIGGWQLILDLPCFKQEEARTWAEESAGKRKESFMKTSDFWWFLFVRRERCLVAVVRCEELYISMLVLSLVVQVQLF